MESKTNKNLGQHWLRDATILADIAGYANLTPNDTVLEIGPGLGTLTSVLAERAGHIVAVEFDRELAEKLISELAGDAPRGSAQKCFSKKKFLGADGAAGPASDLEVVNADFLQFDLDQLPADYKVVANIPYYITNKIVMKLLTATNKPQLAVLLVQKEVAERLAAAPGKMSVLSVATQLYSTVDLGQIIPAAMFDPPPKVDSQIVILHPHLAGSFLAKDIDEKQFFRVVKAGFSARRKKLRTALSGGLNISVTDAEKLLRSANIDPNLRAQDLSLDDWQNLSKLNI
ncbi:16S rRNA (adenine(1518)-N(6)/adenine(1519)-N(6))-dimethyltransferase RsmA [Candidatus Saccharibacteria bacterium]|nr:16S rRNA (adenine(1518)-N(6)/adenine(1519)-N(6))-dimethyltransferase RsmA [Candidatus Saccharibacteria bacterium]